MRYLLLYILLLNLLDAFLTMYGLHYGHITESNPLMNTLYHTNPWLFLLFKGALSVFLLILLYHLNPDKRFSKALLLVSITAAVSYSFICLMHGYWLWEVTGSRAGLA
ncbi:DUF5658 family protein [Rossellomorea sp. NPDC077527]|uniref:DUF5658 family protein n=1 Tax=Rossellomorea sp. NPDC077527 TaxID=3364510 RepID=UPI0037C70E45